VALALLTLLLAPLPRLLERLADWRPQTARFGNWLTIALVLASVVTVIRIYPNYLPYLNALSFGRPGYSLVNDSNLDWNHALPEVESFVRQRGLKEILLDEYAFSEATPYVPEAVRWDCQQAAPDDGGRWAAVSANFMFDAGNCIWLMQYPHESLAGGSMYAIQLPTKIPARGQPGGPPLPANFRYFGGMGTFDPIAIFLACIRDPEQLQPTMDRMMAMMKSEAQKK
jgi:hypothetical protein